MEVILLICLIFCSNFCQAQSNTVVLNNIQKEIEIDRLVFNEKINRDTFIDVYENTRIDTNKSFKYLPNLFYLEQQIEAIQLPFTSKDSLSASELFHVFQEKYLKEYKPSKFQNEYLTILGNLLGIVYLDNSIKTNRNNLEVFKKEFVALRERSASFTTQTHQLIKNQKYQELSLEIASYNLMRFPYFYSIISNNFDFLSQVGLGMLAIKYAVFRNYPNIQSEIKQSILKGLHTLDQYYIIINSVAQKDYYLIGEKKWFDLIVNVLEKRDLFELYTMITSNYSKFFQLLSKDLLFRTIGNQLLEKDYLSYKDILLKTDDINVLRDYYAAMCSTNLGRDNTKQFLINGVQGSNEESMVKLYEGFKFCFDSDARVFLNSQKRKLKSKVLKEYVSYILESESGIGSHNKF